MQTTGRIRLSLWSSNIRGLTLTEPFSRLAHAVNCQPVCPVLLAAALFPMVAVLKSGGVLIPYGIDDQLRWLIRSCWLAFIVNRICKLSAVFHPYETEQR